MVALAELDIRIFRIRCPASMLAVNRIISVIGRIKFLINSIITIKGINKVGVPNGTWWAMIDLFILNNA
jgi:hypothetical protein